jgi:excinuclease ABC subunit C
MPCIDAPPGRDGVLRYLEYLHHSCGGFDGLFRNGVPDKDCYRRYRVRTVAGQDDFASMAEVVRRRYSRVLLEAREANPDVVNFSQENPVEALERVEGGASFQLANQPDAQVGNLRHIRLPDLIIVDGGKGQLSSACRELQRLGLHDLPIIGLAKEYEEIYRPGRALPLQLPPDSGALRLLQRIRDEAHRFANAYHQLLMKKRVGESILTIVREPNRKSLLCANSDRSTACVKHRWTILPRPKESGENWLKTCIAS